MLTAREANAIRKRLDAIYRNQRDRRISEPARMCLVTLLKAERATNKRLSRRKQ